jgi:hypothetical protein
MVFVLFVEKIVYDIRVKSDFILREGIFEKFMGFFKYPISHGFEVTFTTLLIKLKPQYLKHKSVLFSVRLHLNIVTINKLCMLSAVGIRLEYVTFAISTFKMIT